MHTKRITSHVPLRVFLTDFSDLYEVFRYVRPNICQRTLKRVLSVSRFAFRCVFHRTENEVFHAGQKEVRN